MKPQSAEKILSVLLRMIGSLLLCATFAMFLPTAFMEWSHGKLGLGEFPHHPLTQYLTRSVSALYALHGAVLFYAGMDPRGRIGLVRLLAVSNILFGLALFGIDWKAGMPTLWALSEGPGIALPSCLILALSYRMMAPNDSSQT